MKILLVDDEPSLIETVETKFRREGYTVFTAGTAEDGMRVYKQTKPDILILDVNLPHRSGFELAKAIRRDSEVPIIFLTARSDETDRVFGLDLGGDDYVVKPFNLRELAARVKAVLRRTGTESSDEPFESGNLYIDPKAHLVRRGDEILNLSPKEFALLRFLARNSGQVFTRDVLLDRVWGPESFVSARTIDVHIRWLRERIEDNPAIPTRILTIRGVGYKFVA